MKYLIEVFWSEEDKGYIAVIPDLPGCYAWGTTVDEAVREVEVAQHAWTEACLKGGEVVPEPSVKGSAVGLSDAVLVSNPLPQKACL